MLICTIAGFLTGSAGAWIALFLCSGVTVSLLIIYFIGRFVRGGETAEQDPVLITFNREVLECAKRRGIDLLTDDRLDDTYLSLREEKL